MNFNYIQPHLKKEQSHKHYSMQMIIIQYTVKMLISRYFCRYMLIILIAPRIRVYG